MERPIFIRDINPLNQDSTLVVSIDKKGNITRFNETLERLTGSSKNEVIDVPFLSYFSKQIPEDELNRLLDQARVNPDSLDVDTSFQTIQGENVVVSWTGFAIKNAEDGEISQLNLVGTPQKSTMMSTSKVSDSKKKSTDQKVHTDHKKESKTPQKNASQKAESGELKEKNSSKKKTSKKKKPSKESSTTKKTTNKTKSASKKSSKKKKGKIKIKRKPRKKKTNEQKENEDDNEPSTTEEHEKLKEKSSLLTRAKNVNFSKQIKGKSISVPKFHFSKKQKSLSSEGSGEKVEDLSKNSLKQKYDALQKQNQRLEKENEKLNRDLQSLEFNKKQMKRFFNSRFRFIRDSIGIEKKREEFQQMMQQLSERKQKLEHLETEMVLEKKKFKEKIEELVTWREKLEKLEQEIEKRRKFLTEQESFLNEQYDKVLSHELTQPASYIQQPQQEENNGNDDPGILEKDDLFNSLTVEAAVLQRGRIKKANKRFAEMLGYSEKELVGKHLVDFVGPSGLSGVEQHYMNRLKGMDDASYQTVFVSRKDDEIPVKVTIKISDFQGERAEIATFNEL